MKNKNKILKIKFELPKDFNKRTRRELRDVIEGKKTHVQRRDVMIFSSLSVFQNLMSEQKYFILATIRNLKPGSIYQLAKLVGRDFANVKKDCDALVEMGFTVYEKTKNKRGAKAPRLKFDYHSIEVQLPEMVYSHFLGDLAA